MTSLRDSQVGQHHESRQDLRSNSYNRPSHSSRAEQRRRLEWIRNEKRAYRDLHIVHDA